MSNCTVVELLDEPQPRADRTSTPRARIRAELIRQLELVQPDGRTNLEVMVANAIALVTASADIKAFSVAKEIWDRVDGRPGQTPSDADERPDKVILEWKHGP